MSTWSDQNGREPHLSVSKAFPFTVYYKGYWSRSLDNWSQYLFHRNMSRTFTRPAACSIAQVRALTVKVTLLLSKKQLCMALTRRNVLVVANYVGKACGIVIPAILPHGSADFDAFAIQYPQPYVHLFWELAALISAALLPRSLISLGKSSELTEHPEA